MKAKVKRGNGFRGVLEYVFGASDKKEERAEIVGGNMAGKGPRELAAEFAAARRQRPEVKNPVWHCSLSLPKGERLDSMAWHQVCERHLQLMGINSDNHMWIAVRHNDTDFDHVHLIVSRIGLDATLWHGRNDVKAAIESTQTLEREFGLKMTPGLNASEPEHPKKSRGEREKKRRTGQASTKERMQSILNKAIQTGAFDVFVETCQIAGLELLPNLARTGRMNGFSFRLDGETMKASDLGSKYKWTKLAAKTGFDPFKHMPLIEELAAKANIGDDAKCDAILKAVKLGELESPKRRTRTIDLLFICIDDGVYAWRKSGSSAFRDMGDRIRFERAPDAAVKAALQLAQAKGWVEVEAVGSIDFRRRAWLQGRILGIKVTGYDPTKDDLITLAERRRDIAVRMAQKETNPLIRQILILKAQVEDELAVHRTNYGEIPSLRIVGETIDVDQYAFVERHADEKYWQFKQSAAASRHALKKLQKGLLSKLPGSSATQAEVDNERNWAAYLAQCERIIADASAERARLVLQVEDMAFWVREIRAGRMPIELRDAIEGRLGAKPYAATVVGSVQQVNQERQINETKDHRGFELDRYDHSPTSELDRPRVT